MLAGFHFLGSSERLAVISIFRREVFDLGAGIFRPYGTADVYHGLLTDNDFTHGTLARDRSIIRELVADASHRKNELRVGRLRFDCTPQTADVNVHGARLNERFVSPDMV